MYKIIVKFWNGPMVFAWAKTRNDALEIAASWNELSDVEIVVVIAPLIH